MHRIFRRQHVSYRDSNLTHILQTSLGGNAKTLIICTVAPCSGSETSSTLSVSTEISWLKNNVEVTIVPWLMYASFDSFIQQSVSFYLDSVWRSLCQLTVYAVRFLQIAVRILSFKTNFYSLPRASKRLKTSRWRTRSSPATLCCGTTRTWWISWQMSLRFTSRM